jgi:hypothetical protein
MSRAERLIGLMKLREALRTRRQARAVGELAGEIDRTQSMKDRLASLIRANTPIGEEMTPFALRSRAWFGQEMQEQLEVLVNRSDFLAIELERARSDLIRHKNRETILEERQFAARQAEIEDRETRAESQMAPRMVKKKN